MNLYLFCLLVLLLIANVVFVSSTQLNTRHNRSVRILCDREPGLPTVILADPQTLHILYGPECHVIDDDTDKPDMSLTIRGEPPLLSYNAAWNMIKTVIILLLIFEVQALLQWAFPQPPQDIRRRNRRLIRRRLAAELNRRDEIRQEWQRLGEEEYHRRRHEEFIAFLREAREADLVALINRYPFNAADFDPEVARQDLETVLSYVSPQVLNPVVAQHLRNIHEARIQDRQREVERVRRRNELMRTRAEREQNGGVYIHPFEITDEENWQLLMQDVREGIPLEDGSLQSVVEIERRMGPQAVQEERDRMRRVLEEHGPEVIWLTFDEFNQLVNRPQPGDRERARRRLAELGRYRHPRTQAQDILRQRIEEAEAELRIGEELEEAEAGRD